MLGCHFFACLVDRGSGLRCFFKGGKGGHVDQGLSWSGRGRGGGGGGLGIGKRADFNVS